MARSIYIPKKVKDDIRKHINNCVPKAVSGYVSACEDEDTLTGHLGACLRTPSQVVHVENDDIRGAWRWSIDYYKFRGRGKNATEKIIGADGIFELNVEGEQLKSQKKSLLFQAKNNWFKDRNLVEQCIKLSNWREAAFVINYTYQKFESFFLDDVIRSNGARNGIESIIDLEIFLNDYFVDCKVGNTSMAYDGTSRTLSWRDVHKNLVNTKFIIGSRIKFNVKPPSNKPYRGKSISQEDIFDHRLDYEPEDLLSFDRDQSIKDLKKARKSLALTYHSDTKYGANSTISELLKKRMQEGNDSYEKIRRKFKKDS